MEHAEYETKKMKDLRKGDIIHTRIPFEENTPDYYNGYHPKEIRGQMFRDRFGQTSKQRYVVVIGRDSSNIMYLPLTSRHSRYDSKHQYTLQDNSMTWKKTEDMKSYVEVDSLRAIPAKEDYEFTYIGRVTENDMVNIMVKLGKRDIDFESKRDQRAYVSRNKEQLFDKQLKENGYTLWEDEFAEKTYINENGRTVRKSRWGLVMYHVPLSEEEVTELVASREGKPMDDFVRAVAHISENSVYKESEGI